MAASTQTLWNSPGPARVRALLWALLASGLMAACGSVLDSGRPARQVYLLQTPSAPPAASGSAAPVLVISVAAVPGLDTDLILALGNDARLVPVANAHWPDHMPEVFTSIIRRYLSETRRFRAVREGELARPGEWQLDLELQAFYGLLDGSGGSGAVQLKMEGLLHCGDEQHVLRLAEESGVDAGGLASLVAAHQRVVDAAMRQLPERITSACADQAQAENPS